MACIFFQGAQDVLVSAQRPRSPVAPKCTKRAVDARAHVPAEVVLWPLRPLPTPHAVCSPHAEMSSAAFHLLALPTQTSQPRSAVELPLPLTLPWPAGQLRKAVHAEWPTALLEKCPSSHFAQPVITTGPPTSAAGAYATVPA